MAVRLDNGIVGAVGVGAVSVALMALGQTYDVTSLTRFWLTVAGFSALTGCLLYWLARFALWCQQDTDAHAALRDRQAIDLARYRRDELTRLLAERDQRKDGAA